MREGTHRRQHHPGRAEPRRRQRPLPRARKDHPNAVGLFAITGNLIGSQSTVLDLHACRGVVVTGNSIYSGYHHAIWAEDCEHLVIGANSIDHNPEYKGKSTDQVVLRHCRNVNWTGGILQHTRAATDAGDDQHRDRAAART